MLNFFIVMFILQVRGRFMDINDVKKFLEDSLSKVYDSDFKDIKALENLTKINSLVKKMESENLVVKDVIKWRNQEAWDKKDIDDVLMTSVAKGSLKGAEFALKNGANPNAVKDARPFTAMDGERTPLQQAIYSENIEMFNLLAQNGGDLSRPIAGYQQTFSNALAYAGGAYRSKEMFKAVLDASSDQELNSAEIKMENGKTLPIIHLLAKSSYSDYETNNEHIEEMIKRGCDVDKKDSLGQTPLLYAVHARNLTTIKLLAEHGANLEAKYSNGVKALDPLFNEDGSYKDFTYRSHDRKKFELGKEDANNEDRLLMEQRLKDIYQIYKGNDPAKQKMLNGKSKGGLGD